MITRWGFTLHVTNSGRINITIISVTSVHAHNKLWGFREFFLCKKQPFPIDVKHAADLGKLHIVDQGQLHRWHHPKMQHGLLTRQFSCQIHVYECRYIRQMTLCRNRQNTQPFQNHPHSHKKREFRTVMTHDVSIDFVKIAQCPHQNLYSSGIAPLPGMSLTSSFIENPLGVWCEHPLHQTLKFFHGMFNSSSKVSAKVSGLTFCQRHNHHHHHIESIRGALKVSEVPRGPKGDLRGSVSAPFGVDGGEAL